MTAIEVPISIRLKIEVDAPPGVEVETGDTAPKAKRGRPRKKKATGKKSSDNAGAAVEPSDTTEAKDRPAPSATPEESGESTQGTKASTDSGKRADDTEELVGVVRKMIRAKECSNAQANAVTHDLGFSTIMEIPREQWGEYLTALDQRITEDK